MTPDTWVAILNKYCDNDSSLAFTGKQLLGAINSRKQAPFQQELDLRGNITALAGVAETLCQSVLLVFFESS
jgi:hypothetical protein